ncbi:hypothetical protein ACP4OV_023592 [Aristida adscensionis]
MASPSSSSTSPPLVSPLLLRPLPCSPLLLSKHRKPFPSPRAGRVASAGAEQRLLRRPEAGRWSRSRRRGRGLACFSYNANNKKPSPSDKFGRMANPSPMGCAMGVANRFSQYGGLRIKWLVEQSVLSYVGFNAVEATIDEKAEILFLGQLSVTLVVLGVIFGITNTFRPFPDDVFRYDIKEPFKLQSGWLLWAGVGLFAAVVSIALVGTAMTYLNGETPERETDSLVLLLPLIGSSTTSTAFLVGITGVLAPLLEETVFRGFLMVSLTKWFPTPVCVLLSAAAFALAHLTPGQFPQLFVLGVALGFSYAQTRNLLTPITIHAFWNSGVILLLTFLQLQGYDVKELLGAS